MLVIATSVNAQESIIPKINYADLEKYVELAKLNYAKRKVQFTKGESLKTSVTVAKMSYFDIFNGSYIYRPNGQSVVDPVNPYNVNGLQFGISVSLGTILQKPFLIKKAKQDYKVAQLELEDFDAELSVEVKKRYYDYIEQMGKLKIYTQSAQDSKGISDSMRSKFEKGQITLDLYNQARIELTSAFSLQIQTESLFLKSKDLLEEIIGQKISTVNQ